MPKKPTGGLSGEPAILAIRLTGISSGLSFSRYVPPRGRLVHIVDAEGELHDAHHRLRRRVPGHCRHVLFVARACTFRTFIANRSNSNPKRLHRWAASPKPFDSLNRGRLSKPRRPMCGSRPPIAGPRRRPRRAFGLSQNSASTAAQSPGRFATRIGGLPSVPLSTPSACRRSAFPKRPPPAACS